MNFEDKKLLMNPSLEKKRVVVTGIGLVTSLGVGTQETFDNIVKGKSGISKVTRIPDKFQASCKIAGEINEFNPSLYLDPKQIRRTDRFVQLAIAASNLAVSDAKLDMPNEDPERVGVVVGSAAGGFLTIEEQYKIIMEKGPAKCSPFTIPMLIVNMASGWISIIHNAKGPNSSAVTACATSAHSIGDAYRIIERGEADIMIAGGGEAPICTLAMAGFSAAKTLSTRNNEPQKASRPFDKDRDGFVMSEGAGILILESYDHAIARKAQIYAELVGYAMTADANDIVAPCANGSGASRAMTIAIKQANIEPSQVDYVNAHGTSTSLGDIAETKAIKTVFGSHATSHKLLVSSTKSMTGHLLGAAGSLEAALSILAMKHSIAPPTINLDNPDPECDLNYVPHEAKHNVNINYALSNSFGFGGHNACLLFKKFSSSNN